MTDLTTAERAYLARPPFTSDRTLNYLVAADLFGWDRAQLMYPPEVPVVRRSYEEEQ